MVRDLGKHLLNLMSLERHKCEGLRNVHSQQFLDEVVVYGRLRALNLAFCLENKGEGPLVCRSLASYTAFNTFPRCLIDNMRHQQFHIIIFQIIKKRAQKPSWIPKRAQLEYSSFLKRHILKLSITQVNTCSL